MRMSRFFFALLIAALTALPAYAQLTEEQQKESGLTADLVRLSIGLEDIEDILWDLDQALVRA